MMITTGGYNIAWPEVANVPLEQASAKECAGIGVPATGRLQRYELREESA